MNVAKRKPDGTPPRLLVLGDLMLDRYTWGDATRVSPEAPVMILKAETTERQLGGAASVARLAAGLEADVRVVGLVGDDREGDEVAELLGEAGASIEGVVRADRPTTLKHRFVGRAAGRHAHQMLRVDREDASALPSGIEKCLVEKVLAELRTADVLVISDYAKGVCSEGILRAAIDEARRLGVPATVDPARGRKAEVYRGCTTLTPNRVEAEALTGVRVMTFADAELAARELLKRCEAQVAAVTLDRDGIFVVGSDGFAGRFPATPREVYDITGAGDMVLAIVSLGAGLGRPIDHTMRLANVAAGLEVERQGIAAVSWSEIETRLAGDERSASLRKILTVSELVPIVEAARRRGERIAFTNGCFDLLHSGHLATLQFAASQGDRLVVAINSDESVRRLKGPERPIVPERQRAELLASLDCVSHVVVYDEATPCSLLKKLRPGALVKGGTTGRVVGREIVEAYGGRVVTAPEVAGVSTTSLIERFRGTSVRQEPTQCT